MKAASSSMGTQSDNVTLSCLAPGESSNGGSGTRRYFLSFAFPRVADTISLDIVSYMRSDGPAEFSAAEA